MTNSDDENQLPPPPPVGDGNGSNSGSHNNSPTPSTGRRKSPVGVIDNTAMAQLMLAMQTHGNAIENLLQSAVKKPPPVFKKPRVGGIDSTGVWTD